MPLLTIVRHGQSVWNLENKFTGNVDVDLTPLGRTEARAAGRKLKGISFGHCFTSALKRAQETLTLILDEMGCPAMPITKDSALNERSYGDLQGLNKEEMARKYGVGEVAVWRRSYSAVPPGGESLENTADRVLPYYRQHIEPLLRTGENILIVAHGNSLRALMMYLENITPEAIADVNLPTGTPRLYTMNTQLAIEKAEYL